MAKCIKWNEIKAFINFIQEYEVCLNFVDAQEKTNYYLQNFDKTIKNYYVYCLINPINKKIFYIGKGKNKRALQHYQDYKKGVSSNFFKTKEIKSFAKYHYKPIVKIIASGLEEEKAYSLETKLIKRLYKSLTNISQNENEPNLLKREIRKILNNAPTYEEWLLNIYNSKPLLFEVLKSKNYGYEIYNVAKNCILNLAKEYGVCQTLKI